MNARELMDSLKFRDAVDHFAATWRYKKAKEKDRIDALQNFLDVLMLPKTLPNQFVGGHSIVAGPFPAMPTPNYTVTDSSPESIVPQDIGPEPRPLPPSGDMNDLALEDRKRIFGLDDPPVPNPTPEQKAAAQAEARAGRLAQLRQFLPNMPMGRKANAVIPIDFPIKDLPSYLAEIGGYGVTDKEPENLAIKSKYSGIHFDAATGQRTQRPTGLPNNGWLVELIKVGP